MRVTTGNGSSIYYNPMVPQNAYLGGLTYGRGGGVLAPVPEPGPLALLAIGRLPVLSRQRRRSQA